MALAGSQLTTRRCGRALLAAAALALAAAAPPPPVLDPVTIDLDKPLNVFTPDDALGAALDGTEAGGVEQSLTAFNIEKMKSAGLRRVSYRTRPELGIEVWHWTEHGTWSDAAHQQGYWTGDPSADAPPAVTWGYSLPRRGDTIDNANNAGYSRLDDGDPASFWKSNPYLEARFTGLAEARPQWIVVSFAALTRFDAARILWASPFARHFLVQYWDGPDGFQEGKQTAEAPGAWRTFPNGERTIEGEPDTAVIRLADRPVASHFIRLLLLRSSQTAPPGSTDVRDRLGFAVRELGFGVVGPDGRFRDAVRHGASRTGQTVTQVSSTDPWHRAADRDPDTEQPSLDLVFGSGLNGGKPLMLPVGVFYDTPQNAVAELAYVRRRGWPVDQVELGEEPDGHFIRPEDYADLYLEWVKALRPAAPGVRFGGPSMQNALTGTWPDTAAGTSWMGRFVAELKAREGLDQLQFFSFEHYVFDDTCRPAGALLRDETGQMERLAAKIAAAGVPRTIPWAITEYGASPFAGRVMSQLPSALLAGDIVGHFLSLGGAQAFMFGFTPDQPANQRFACAGYGNMMLWEADDDGHSRWPMPVYFAERMMTGDWGAPAGQPHTLYAARAALADPQGRPFVVAYPLKAADGRWSVMLINRDQARAHRTPIAFAGGAALGAGRRLSVVQYSSDEYAWLDRGEASRPARDLPPKRFETFAASLTLPPLSLTVVAAPP
ncbi:MAG TPA: discoidin domain-containing protein [Caulobacteraceae bacterium]